MVALVAGTPPHVMFVDAPRSRIDMQFPPGGTTAMSRSACACRVPRSKATV
jgi:hypothetical protein